MVTTGGELTRARVDRVPSEMVLPPCGLPRPGDRVVWYVDATRRSGTLLAYAAKGKASVVTDYQNPVSLDLAILRIEDFKKRREPNWHYLKPPSVVKVPTDQERDAFRRVLAQRMPPGPAYIELVHEVWNRGFEVFLVGGTVRDVLAGRDSNDIDLVTTMPLTTARPLLKAMYRHAPSIDEQNGFVRLGGTPASGDPFVDLKMFTRFEPGAECALFGADFCDDLCFRDFGCNGVYYDPVNEALIDPSGHGIADAEISTLRLVCDVSKLSPFQQAKICVRYLKFMSRGFTSVAETTERIQKEFLPLLSTMKNSLRASYVKTQVLSKEPLELWAMRFEAFKVSVIEIAGEAVWALHFEALREDILV